MEGEFPSNSRRARAQPEPKKKVERVVEGEVLRRKKSISKRFTENFVGGNAKAAWGFVTFDVLIPAAKDAIADAVSQLVEGVIFGEARSRSRRTGRRPGESYIAYNRYSKDPREEQRPQLSSRARATFNFDEIILPTRVEADEVIDQLFELVSKYESATVGDLYAMVGLNASFTDDKWGWYDIRGAGVTRVRNGYLLDLPRPEPLD